MNKSNGILKLNKPVSIKKLLEQRYSYRVEGDGTNPQRYSFRYDGEGSPPFWGPGPWNSPASPPRRRGVPSGSSGEMMDDEELDDEDKGMHVVSRDRSTGSRNVGVDTAIVSGIIGAGSAAAGAAAPAAKTVLTHGARGFARGLDAGVRAAVSNKGSATVAQNIERVAKSAASGGVEGVKRGVEAVKRGRAPITPTSAPITPTSAPITPTSSGGPVKALPPAASSGGPVKALPAAAGSVTDEVGSVAGKVGSVTDEVGSVGSAAGKATAATSTAGKVASSAGKVASSAGKTLLKSTAKTALKFLPGVGAVMSGVEAYDQLKKGNYAQAAGRAALGAISLLGPVGGLVGLAGNLGMDAFTEQSTTYYRNLLLEEVVNKRNKGSMTKDEISSRDRLAKRVKARAIKGNDTELNARHRLATYITLKNRTEGPSKKKKRTTKDKKKNQ